MLKIIDISQFFFNLKKKNILTAGTGFDIIYHAYLMFVYISKIILKVMFIYLIIMPYDINVHIHS